MALIVTIAYKKRSNGAIYGKRDRMEAEKAVFGRYITRELTEDEVRNAMVFINGVI